MIICICDNGLSVSWLVSYIKWRYFITLNRKAWLNTWVNLYTMSMYIFFPYTNILYIWFYYIVTNTCHLIPYEESTPWACHIQHNANNVKDCSLFLPKEWRVIHNPNTNNTKLLQSDPIGLLWRLIVTFEIKLANMLYSWEHVIGIS